MGFFDNLIVEELGEMGTPQYQKNLINEINTSIQTAKRMDMLDSAGEISDGYHTFNELYHHRALLFASLCAAAPKDRVWKSKLHDDDTMFDDMFIVGIQTDEGQATYHYDIDPYWDMFDVPELDKAPKFDGHTPEDALNRVFNYFTKR